MRCARGIRARGRRLCAPRAGVLGVLAQHVPGKVERAAHQDARGVRLGGGDRSERARHVGRRASRRMPSRRASAAASIGSRLAGSSGTGTVCTDLASGASGRRKPASSLVLSMPTTRCSGRRLGAVQARRQRLAGGRIVAAVEPQLAGLPAGSSTSGPARQPLQARRAIRRCAGPRRAPARPGRGRRAPARRRPPGRHCRSDGGPRAPAAAGPRPASPTGHRSRSPIWRACQSRPCTLSGAPIARGALLDHAQRLGRLRPDDAGHARLQDAGLLERDLLETLAEERLVIERDRRERGEPRAARSHWSHRAGRRARSPAARRRPDAGRTPGTRPPW